VFLSQSIGLVLYSCKNISRIIRDFMGYFFLLFAAVIFVIVNGGVVVGILFCFLPVLVVVLVLNRNRFCDAGMLIWRFAGDRSNHIATFHFPQLLYFVAFAAIFLGTLTISPWQLIAFYSHLARRLRLRFAISTSVALYVLYHLIQRFTYVVLYPSIGRSDALPCLLFSSSISLSPSPPPSPAYVRAIHIEFLFLY
jgi:hypothetical protein